MNTMTTNETMTPDFDQLWKILAGAGGTIITVGLMLRSYLSKSAVSRAGDQADIGTITRLNKLLDEERKARREADQRADMFSARADSFAKERNDAIHAMGKLEGQIQALTFQVSLMQKQLDNYVKAPNTN